VTVNCSLHTFIIVSLDGMQKILQIDDRTTVTMRL
jgi:hypothetical protein